jgi:hypothetical protein
MVLLRSFARGTNRRSVFRSSGRSSERGLSLRTPRPQGRVRVRLRQLTRGGEWWRSFCRLAGGGECGCSYYSDVAHGDEGRRFWSIAPRRERGCRFGSLAGSGECGCSYYSNVARGRDEGRRFWSMAPRRERGCRFGSLAGSGECGCSYYSNVARGRDEGRRFCSIARRRERGCSFQSVAGTCVCFCISKELLGTVPLGKQMLDEEVIGQTARTRAEPLPPACDLAQSVVAATATFLATFAIFSRV